MASYATADDRKPSPGKDQQFEFITISGTNVRGDVATRKRVRSRAQADYRRRMRAAQEVQFPRPSLHVNLDVAEWLRAVSVGATSAPQTCHQVQHKLPPGMTSSGSESTSSSEPTGSDVFALMTADQRERAKLLWSHLYGGTCIVFKSMVEIGFLDIIRGSAALIQMLSSAAWHMDTEDPQAAKGSAEYARYSVMATSSLRRMLCEPKTRASIETIIAILCFAAYANLTSDTQLINVHLDGLCHALSYFGGLNGVETMPIIRMMIYWIDVRGSFLQDVVPRFPQPFDILVHRSQIDLAPLSAPLSALPIADAYNDPVVARIRNSIEQVNSVIDRQYGVEKEHLWHNLMFPHYNLAPITHHLLSMSAAKGVNDDLGRRRECFRLAAILYMTELKAKFGMDRTGANIYADKFQVIFAHNSLGPSTGLDDSLTLWMLVGVATSARLSDVARRQCTQWLKSHTALMGCGDFADISGLIPGSLWCESALGRLSDALEKLRRVAEIVV